MKRFTFRLQTLLDIRKAREREIQFELARIVSIQNRERARQEELRRRIEEQKALFGEKMKRGAYTPAEAILFQRFVDVSIRAIEAAEETIQSMEPQIREVRERLVEASRGRKVVEKLKERRLKEYQYEVNRELNKEIDEMNQKIFAAKIKEAAGAR